MSLLENLKRIETFLRKEPKKTKHFAEQCKLRDLEIEKVLEQFKKAEIVAITEQEENKYLISIKYKQHKDLNIVLALESINIRLITIYPCKTERRERKK